MDRYDFSGIEKKWQEAWKASGIYRAIDGSPKKKFYALIEFPYPSGDGLHVGHVRSYTALDVLARKRRMEGWNVLYPIGWDAFGLPTENYAVKTGIHPAEVTKQNTDIFRRQLQSLGFSFDWDREVNTTDPAYYRWTQWIFIQLFKKGLAYKAKTTINWCPSCTIGLANEEVVAGKCERCGASVEARIKEQWMLRITAYAEKLLAGLDQVDFLSRIKDQQVNWIGKSEGARIKFPIVGKFDFPGKSNFQDIEVFTTRPDTLFGATFLVVSPEHELVKSLKLKVENWDEVERYVQQAANKSEEERTAEEKTGVFPGVYAINPANQEKIPVWISDYVLAGYGTGAIMAVPAHDERDFEFAKKFHLPVRMVVCPHYPAPSCPVLDHAFEGTGHLVDSGKFDGMDSEAAKWAITEFVGGKRETQYHLRDWVFSRQRYWGEPIPITYCRACWERGEERKKTKEKGGDLREGVDYAVVDGKEHIIHAVPEGELPVILPDVKEFKPRDDGESPLASVESWVATTCPICGAPARRETDTMPNWAGSSWYFLRYTDPKNDTALASPEKLRYWMPVDWYNGGMEHTTLHVLYSRFWNLFLHDIGAVPVAEPYAKRTSHGMILGTGGVKMSKSKENVVNPDDVVSKYGADVLRLYELFIGPFDQAIPWDEHGLKGIDRFLKGFWEYFCDRKSVQEKYGINHSQDHPEHESLRRVLHRSIKKITEDIEVMKYNTAVSQFMILMNKLDTTIVSSGDVSSGQKVFLNQEESEKVVTLLAPFAPHVTEEIWHKILGNKTSIHMEVWPTYAPAFLVDETATIVVQVNGRPRATVTAPRGANQAAVEALARVEANVVRHLTGEVRKIVFIPDRLINFVI